ncbi:MAG: TraB/GumN family protein [Pseudomonadota bacterium]
MLRFLCLVATSLGMAFAPLQGAAARVPLAQGEGPQTIAEATAGPSQVALWRVEDEDTTIYLFGTIHILNPEIEWQHQNLRAAWDASQTVYFEADVTSPEAMDKAAALITEKGFHPPGVTLSSYFTSEQQVEINQGLSVLGVNLSALDSIRPWLAGVQVANAAYAKAGGDPMAGVEMILGNEAEIQQKQVRYFETLEEQISILADGDDAEQAKIFYEGMEDLINIEAYFAQMIAAWYQGDISALGQILLEAFEDTPKVQEELLYNRNAVWAAEVNRIIYEEPGTFFIAVGAGHLAGEKSVQDYLSGYGHTTTRLSW